MEHCAWSTRNAALVVMPLVVYPSSSSASATVSWPASDGGLAKSKPSTDIVQRERKQAGGRSSSGLDGREQLAKTEIDLSALALDDLPMGEVGVREGVRRLISKDPKIAASLLRLAFHDAIARDTEIGEGGANGSIRFELGRRVNYGLQRPITALGPIQAVSGLTWADTIAVAGAEAVAVVGGPAIAPPLGRKDSASADPLNLARPVGKCQGPTVQGGGTSCRLEKQDL